MTILSSIVPAGISPAAVANILEAAERIHGPRSVVFLGGEEPITLFGAVLVATFGHPYWPVETEGAEDLVRAVEVALREHLKVVDLHAWSDAHSPAEQRAVLADVAAALRTTADKPRKQVA